MKKACLIALILITCLFSLTASASVPNPIASSDVGIRLLEDFNYQTLEDFYGRRFTDVEKKKMAITDSKYKFDTGIQTWATVTLPIKGFSKKGEILEGTSGEAGNISGAQGIGMYMDCRAPYGVSQCTPSIIMEKDGKERTYKLAPETTYYLVAKDGVTYEGRTYDSGWGDGILGDIAQNFEGYIIIPFTSFFYNGEALDSSSYLARTLELTAYDGSALFDNIFIYGNGLTSQSDGIIRDFFEEPARVDHPTDYEITDRIKNVFGLSTSGDSGSSPTLEPWVAPVVAGISLLFVVYALITVIRKNRKED